MLGHRRPPTRFEAAAAVAAMTIAVAGCTSGSDAVPVPGADEVVTATVASIDDAALDTPLPEESQTTAAPEPAAAEPTPESTATTTPATTPTTTITTTTTSTTSIAPPVETSDDTDAGGDVFLRLGDEGDEVGLMQFKLSVLKYLPTGSDDGVFDEATESGLRQFQSDYGLGVDGVFGPVTERSLNAALQSVNVEN